MNKNYEGYTASELKDARIAELEKALADIIAYDDNREWRVDPNVLISHIADIARAVLAPAQQDGVS